MKAMSVWLATALVAATPVAILAQPAPVPIVLPHPPPVINAASSQIFNAMLAISRAQQTNPRAAQAASFDYAKAVQQYRIGDGAGAQRSAARAEMTAAQPAPSAPVATVRAPLPPGAPPRPGLQGGLYGADAPAIDADSFLALARGILADCAARHDSRLAAARKHQSAAESAFARSDWQATRREAKAAIDACAAPAAP